MTAGEGENGFAGGEEDPADADENRSGVDIRVVPLPMQRSCRHRHCASKGMRHTTLGKCSYLTVIGGRASEVDHEQRDRHFGTFIVSSRTSWRSFSRKVPLARRAAADSQGPTLPSRSTLTTANLDICWRSKPHSNIGKSSKTSVVRID